MRAPTGAALFGPTYTLGQGEIGPSRGLSVARVPREVREVIAKRAFRAVSAAKQVKTAPPGAPPPGVPSNTGAWPSGDRLVTFGKGERYRIENTAEGTCSEWLSVDRVDELQLRDDPAHLANHPLLFKIADVGEFE